MLKYSQMLTLCREIVEALQGARVAGFGEAGENRWVLIFNLETAVFRFKQGNGTERLFLCLQPPYCRFHLTGKNWHLRNTPFSQFVAGRIQNASLKEVSLVGNDRILSLQFESVAGSYILLFELFSRSPGAYLLNADWTILSSVKPSAKTVYKPPVKLFDNPSGPEHCTSSQIEKEYLEREQQDQLNTEKKMVLGKLARELKKQKRGFDEMKNGIEEGEKWKQEERDALLLQSFFHLLRPGLSEIVVEDWEQNQALRKIALDPALSPAEQLKLRFKTSRKLKRRLELCTQFFQERKEKIDRLKKTIEEIEAVHDIKELKAFEKTGELPKKERVMQARAAPFRIFSTQAEIFIYAGRNDKENEKLTFSFARGSDLWLHAANYPGSHLIVKMKKGQKIDADSLQDALQLALYFSKARGRDGEEVIVTEQKNVAKARGKKPGQVNIGKHKKVTVRIDTRRLQRLLGS